MPEVRERGSGPSHSGASRGPPPENNWYAKEHFCICFLYYLVVYVLCFITTCVYIASELKCWGTLSVWFVLCYYLCVVIYAVMLGIKTERGGVFVSWCMARTELICLYVKVIIVPWRSNARVSTASVISICVWYISPSQCKDMNSYKWGDKTICLRIIWTDSFPFSTGSAYKYKPWRKDK